MPPSGARKTAVELALVVTSKLAACGAAWGLGFRAVSDDDFARVVLAQELAHAPRLDPTGTSWLPLPFWLTGGLMRALGDTSLTVARTAAVALGLASAALVYAAARILVRDRRAALAGALLAAVFPWSARLGVATVPELPTAAMSLFGAATLATPSTKARFAGAALLSCACLCRYEPWPLAVAFALATLFERDARSGSLAPRASSAALALVGPAAWLLHNRIAHGEALHFLGRVSAYRRAVAGEASLHDLVAYPLALVREEPELWLVAAGATLVGTRPLLGARFARPAVALTSMVALLSAAAMRGGAPTHHAGRAVLAVWLAVAVYAGAAIATAFLRGRPERRAVLALSAASIALGVLILRPWYARLDSMTTRTRELSIGAAASALPRDARVLVEVRDFGFFAVEAASGAPWNFVLDRELDPRVAARESSFATAALLERRIAAVRATHVVGEVSEATRHLGPPLAMADGLGLFRVEPSPDPTTSAPRPAP